MQTKKCFVRVPFSCPVPCQHELILHFQTEYDARLRDFTLDYYFLLKFYRNLDAPWVKSRILQVTQLRTDGTHHREYLGQLDQLTQSHRPIDQCVLVTPTIVLGQCMLPTESFRNSSTREICQFYKQSTETWISSRLEMNTGDVLVSVCRSGHPSAVVASSNPTQNLFRYTSVNYWNKTKNTPQACTGSLKFVTVGTIHRSGLTGKSSSLLSGGSEFEPKHRKFLFW